MSYGIKTFARAVGVSPATVRRWLARDDWPLPRKAPFTEDHVVFAKKWRESLQPDLNEEQNPNAAAASPASGRINDALKASRIRLLQAQTKRLEGQYVDRQVVVAALAGLARAFVATLDELERALPEELAGLDPARMEVVIRDRHDEARRRLAEQQSIELEGVEQAVASANKPKARGRPRTGS